MKDFNDLPKNNGTLSLIDVAQQVGINQRRGEIIPGRFYYFKTQSPIPNLNEQTVFELSGKNYFDLSPVGLLLFHDYWKDTALMLNLKVIPPIAISKILEAYWKFSQLNGLNNLFNKNGNLLSINERRLIDQRFYLITPSILSSILGVNNLNYAINNYNMDLILEAKMIDWDQFGMMINPIATNKGLFPNPINLTKVYEDFLTNTLI
jgi:hypothetical protein